VQGLRGKASWVCSRRLSITGAAWAKSLRVVAQINSGLCIGPGGYVTGPGGLLLAQRIPLVIPFEQNAVVGTAKPFAGPTGPHAAVKAFPGSFAMMPSGRSTGNRCARNRSGAGHALNGEAAPPVLVLGAVAGCLAVEQS